MRLAVNITTSLIGVAVVAVALLSMPEPPGPTVARGSPARPPLCMIASVRGRRCGLVRIAPA